MPSLQTTPPQHARGKSPGLRSRDGCFLRQLRQRARPSVFVAEDGYRPQHHAAAISCQPAGCAGSEGGGFCQTGLTRVIAIMNIRGGLHHKTFATIANSIQRQLYGVVADTLAESRRTVHRAISLSVQHQHLFYTFLTLYNSDIVFKNITGRFYNALPLYTIQDCCLQPGAQ